MPMPADMGLLTAVSLLPHLLFSLPAGVWLERIQHRKRVMIAADLGRAVLIASVPAAYISGVLTIQQLYVVGFLVGSLTVLFDLSWSTVFVAIAPRELYVQGNSLLNASRSLSFVARADARRRARAAALRAGRARRGRRVVHRVGAVPRPGPRRRGAGRAGSGGCPRAVRGGAAVRRARPDHPADARGCGDDQLLQLCVRARCSCCT